jgi:exodeoxyribonuclease VII large subunit
VGHEIDVTLSDLVADVRAATPSEAAERVVPASEEIAQFLERQQRRLLTALRGRAAQARARVNAMANCRVFRRPTEGLHVLARQLEDLESRSARAVDHRMQRARAAAEAVAGRLNSLSPLSVLGRGYSLTRRLPDERLVLDGAELSIGDRLITRFGSGQAVSRVEEIHE